MGKKEGREEKKDGTKRMRGIGEKMMRGIEGGKRGEIEVEKLVCNSMPCLRFYALSSKNRMGSERKILIVAV